MLLSFVVTSIFMNSSVLGVLLLLCVCVWGGVCMWIQVYMGAYAIANTHRGQRSTKDSSSIALHLICCCYFVILSQGFTR